jgi:carboxypeptidase T
MKQMIIFITMLLGTVMVLAEPYQNHMQVRFIDLDQPQLEALVRAEYDLIPPLHPDQPEALLTVEEFNTLQSFGYRMETVHDNVEEFYRSRLDQDRDMGGFYTFDEAVAQMDALHDMNPDISTARFSIGTSHQGRGIWCMKVSDNPNVTEDEPRTLINGLHHAREPISIHVTLHTMEYLITNYGTDDLVTWLVDNRELYFVPVVNPDGYEYNRQTNPNGGGMWRKNRRDNNDGTWGVDANRNYGYYWGYNNEGSSPYTSSDVYRGPYAFSEPCVVAIRDLMESVEFFNADHYHSYGNLVIYPWGYNGGYPSQPDYGRFIAMSDSMVAFNGYEPGNGWDTVQYATNGDAVDWSYGEQITKEKVFGVTSEVGSYYDGFWPNPANIPTLVSENLGPNLYLFKCAGPWIATTGQTIDDSAGNGNGEIEPGETISIDIDAVNAGIIDATGISCTVSSDCPYITITSNSATFADMVWNGSGSSASPVVFDVAAGAPDVFVIEFAWEYIGNGIPAGFNYSTIMVGEPDPLFFDDFSTDLGWTGYGGSGEWERGTANGGSGSDNYGDPDPSSDHSDSGDDYLIGNDLAGGSGGDYSSNLSQTYWLTSPSIDCSNFTDVSLDFWRWLGLERNSYDHGYIAVFDGSDWVEIWSNPASTYDETSWNHMQMDVSEWADGNADFRVRFGIGETDGSWQYCGWNIDDFTVIGVEEMTSVPPVDDLTATYLEEVVYLWWTYDLPWSSFNIQYSETPYGPFTTIDNVTVQSWENYDPAGSGYYRVIVVR